MFLYGGLAVLDVALPEDFGALPRHNHMVVCARALSLPLTSTAPRHDVGTCQARRWQWYLATTCGKLAL